MCDVATWALAYSPDGKCIAHGKHPTQCPDLGRHESETLELRRLQAAVSCAKSAVGPYGIGFQHQGRWWHRVRGIQS